jgi:hypothetical protein
MLCPAVVSSPIRLFSRASVLLAYSYIEGTNAIWLLITPLPNFSTQPDNAPKTPLNQHSNNTRDLMR